MNSKHVVFTESELHKDDSRGNATTQTEESAASSDASSSPAQRDSKRSIQRRRRPNKGSQQIIEQRRQGDRRIESREAGRGELVGLPPLGLFQQQFFMGDQRVAETSSSPPSCANCAEMENKLIVALDDLDYVRQAALGAADGAREVAPPPAVVQDASHSRLAKASKQIQDITTRHKKQVEELTKERVSAS